MLAYMIQPPAALTIAGSDSGGAAGIQADLLTFASHHIYGTSAITCITAQNPSGITSIQPSSPELVAEQISQVLKYYPVATIKTGMLFSAPIIETVANALVGPSEGMSIVVDPVSVSSSGSALLQPEAIAALTEKLFPLAAVITPNLDEAELLLSRKIDSPEAIKDAAIELASTYDTVALVKGGHLAGDDLADAIAMPEGESTILTQKRIRNIDTHGSGCTLSSAIAANLALEIPMLEAIKNARRYLRKGMEQRISLGGENFINHLPA